MSQSNGMSSGSYKKVLSIDSINPAVVEAKYAVRGELALRANALTEQLKEGGLSDLPFSDVVHCEIGNPQALDQKPLSFIRQVEIYWEVVMIGSCVDGIPRPSRG
jgi:alanine transaminase